MNIFCIDDFISEIEKLKKHNPYRGIEKYIIESIFDKSIDELKSGRLLNGDFKKCYIKKRVKGSSGYRLYFYLLVEDENIYLMFFHPKTGPCGTDNIKDEFKASIFKKIVRCIIDQELYEVKCCEKKEKLIFKKVEIEIIGT